MNKFFATQHNFFLSFVLSHFPKYLLGVSQKLEKRTKKHLQEIESNGLRRVLREPHGVDLSSNDYLCLSQHTHLKQAMISAVEKEGCGSTASRLLRGERECFAEIEKRFAGFKETESALFFCSGYAANTGLLTAFLEEGDTVFTDELNHASLIDGIRLSKAKRVIFPHNDFGALNNLIKTTACEGQRFLVTESLFSMDGDVAPLDKYAKLCRKTNTALIVDEAHAVGIYGEKGSGFIEKFGIGEDVFLSMNTCGKALGVSGAFVCGDDWAIDYLIQRARSFIFSTAAPPAVCAAIGAALDLIEEEPERRERLLSLSKFLGECLHENRIGVPDFSFQLPDSKWENPQSQIIPIIIGDSERAVAVASHLQREGFDVRAVRPPTVPKGTARLRVSLNVGVDENMLSEFVTRLKTALEKIDTKLKTKGAILLR